MTKFADLAAQVGRALSRDNGRKAAIISKNPEAFYARDAAEIGTMSAHEAAAAALAKRGVRLEPGEDGERMLEVHDMGVDWGRARARHGGAAGSWGVDAHELPADNAISKYLRGEPTDSARGAGMDGAGGGFVDKYLQE